MKNCNGRRRQTRATSRVKSMSTKRPVTKYVAEYLAADDVEGWLGSGAGWVRRGIEEATRLVSKGKKKYTLAINTNIDLDRWAVA
jgi:hypothetical protein